MRAAFIEAHGPAESIRVDERPDPSPDPGELLVRVRAVAFNPIDLYLRSGAVAMPMAFPYVVGADFAGTVAAVGAGGSRFKPGDRVWGSNQGFFGRQGVASELAAIGEEWAYPTPDGVTDAQAAAVALVGITAHLGLFEKGRLQSGETVYVAGGTGGVGSMVVQMAKAAGARVATTAGGPEHVEQCRTLGADLALDYKTDDVPARLREFAPDGIDLWYETQREPDLMTIVPLLHRGGRVILMAGRDAKPCFPLGSFYPRDCSILGFAMFNSPPETQRRAADEISRWMTEGKLHAQIGRTFPLAQAAAAQSLLEANTIHRAGTLTGKVVLTIP